MDIVEDALKKILSFKFLGDGVMEENKLLISKQLENKTRNQGIDLLRIISMFMVLLQHILEKGVLDNVQDGTVKGEFFWVIAASSYCAVNCYALISGYVGINAKHKYTNLISLCLQLAFYAILITGAEIIISMLNGTGISLKTIVLHILPSIKGGYYWYFSAYFCLFFFMPILNYVINNIQRVMLKRLAIFILIIFCGWNMLMSNVSGIDFGFSFLWLAILYALGGYLAKYKTLEKLSISKSFFGYFVCIVIAVLGKIAIYLLTTWIFNKPIANLVFMAYNSPTMVLAALFLLSAFSKMKIKKGFSRIISIIAPLTFGVYLIHCHPYIIGSLNGAFVWIAKKPIYWGVFYVFACALAIFAACIILDWIRSLIFRLCRIKRFAGWIEKVIGVVIGWFCKLLHVSLNEEENIEQIDKKTEPKLE